MNWASTPPTAPGIYLWRAKGDRMKRWRLVRLAWDGQWLRVDEQQDTDRRCLILKPTSRLRGEWIGPITENSHAT